MVDAHEFESACALVSARLHDAFAPWGAKVDRGRWRTDPVTGNAPGELEAPKGDDDVALKSWCARPCPRIRRTSSLDPR